jgi:hypothetical protein
MNFFNKYKYIIASGVLVIAGVLLTYRAKAASFAKKWVGVNENGFNASFSNDVFQAMMKKVGWKGGDAWCMYFAKAVHYETFPKDADKINKILVGSTQQSWRNVEKDTTNTYKLITSGKPKLGDIAIWTNANDTSKGHAGVVIKSGSDSFTTVEGNTNYAGSREGDAVLQKERQLKYNKKINNNPLILKGFIRKVII